MSDNNIEEVEVLLCEMIEYKCPHCKRWRSISVHGYEAVVHSLIHDIASTETQIINCEDCGKKLLMTGAEYE